MDELTTIKEEPLIRSAFHPACALCGSQGQVRYQALKDQLFGTKGDWNLKQCSNPGCGLTWLDPMPMKEDLGKAYANYYTHATPDQKQRTEATASKESPWKQKKAGIIRSVRNRINQLDWRRAPTAEVRFLKSISNGRLLDVGCGSGDWLEYMTEKGWCAQGVDFDEQAVTNARRKGLRVTCGSLEQQKFADNSFHALTLNHVIEHIYDPLATLVECKRILKPDGRLVLFTPNSSSLGHKFFKKHWRGLEPPRHLHIFSRNLCTECSEWPVSKAF